MKGNVQIYLLHQRVMPALYRGTDSDRAVLNVFQ